MSGISKKLMGTTAAGAGFLAIEDVFSTYLYTGNGSTQTITNGIDLAGEGGLVWIKDRTSSQENVLYDTERGAGTRLVSNAVFLQSYDATTLTSFNSNGFSLGSKNYVNVNTYNFASWTFRKAPRFFDVVTWTGDGTSGRTINHNLGTTVGFVTAKITNATSGWLTHHKDLGFAIGDGLLLNTTDAIGSYYSPITASSDTTITILDGWNTSGQTYVAYLFAHDPLGPSGDGSDGLIACGSYTGNSSGVEINIGWEPQWFLCKKTNGTSDWQIFDVMRGMHFGTTTQSVRLSPNTSGAETSQLIIGPSPTGVSIPDASDSVNINGGTYIYIAIRRGPMRQPTSGTEVFNVEYQAGTDTRYRGYLGNPVDAWLLALPSNVSGKFMRSRLQGRGNYLDTTSTAAEAAQTDQWWDNNLGVGVAGTTYTPSTSTIHYLFRRAPGFFDVVAYTGQSSSGRQKTHNLGVAPELLIVKSRSNIQAWSVLCTLNGGLQGRLNETTALSSPSAAVWGDGTSYVPPTDSIFTVGTDNETNATGWTYIAYLFATLPGVSKVGSYTGNGSSQTINCGFTSGARFVLIKRTDSTGDWYVWDTARGIVAANDPHLSLNTTAAEVTTDDSVDPDSSGFVVNQVAATNVNVSSASYIYLAIS